VIAIYAILTPLALVAAFVLGQRSLTERLRELREDRNDCLTRACAAETELDDIRSTRHLAGKKAWEKRKANLNDSSTAPEDFSGLAVIDTEPSANLSITIDAGEGAE